MKYTKYIIVAAIAAALSSAQAALITDEGAATPVIGSGNVNTGDSTVGNLGTRPVDWTSTTKRQARGQSFTLSGTGNYSLDAIWVRVGSSEDFSQWTANSLHMSILSDPVTKNNTPFGAFDYDATGLGTVDASDWLRLDVSGVTLAAGTEYSFLLTGGEANANHLLSLTRQKTSNVYTGGSELNTNDYLDGDTDLWDGIAASASNLFFYAEATVVPEPATLGLVAMVGTGILFVRRRLML